MRKLIERIIFEDKPLLMDMLIVDRMIAKLLRESDLEKQDALLALLRRWEMRVLFVEALQEEKDRQDKSINSKV